MHIIKFNYRLPYEFYGCGHNWLGAFRYWAFHYWYDNILNVYEITGFRVLGFEIVFRTSL